MIGKHQIVAELLLERGADPNVQDGNNTPLHLALQSGLVERAKLLARGTDSNARDDDNTIPLPWSS
jgi:ankyrin repeat protein